MGAVVPVRQPRRRARTRRSIATNDSTAPVRRPSDTLFALGRTHELRTLAGPSQSAGGARIKHRRRLSQLIGCKLMPAILFVASEWWPAKGGVSSFNIELAAAAARLGHEPLCVVRSAQRQEIEDARSLGVTLLSAVDHGSSDNGPFSLGTTPDVVVGHDRWTGPLAARWRAMYPSSRLAHVLHVHPELIDGHKSEFSISERSARVEQARFQIDNADASFAVGEMLRSRWLINAPQSRIEAFNPGLPHLLPSIAAARSPHPIVLILGRAEDAELKGINLAARALRLVAKRSFNDVEFVVRGLADGTAPAFEAKVRRLYPRSHRFTSRPYVSDRQRVAEDISTASLLIQPSLEEGFGLSTLESIALGTPTLVSDRSGVAKYIQAVSAAPVVVRAGDVQAWATAIERVLQNESAARAEIEALREELNRRYSWASATEALIQNTLSMPIRPTSARARSIGEQLDHANQNLIRVHRLTSGRWIQRGEERVIDAWLSSTVPEHESGCLLLVGDPGTGKTALLSTLTTSARNRQIPVVGIKADLVPVTVRTAEQLRSHLRFEIPILRLLEDQAHVYGCAILVIDQLDALCELIDTRTSRLNILLQLARDACQLPNVRVVASVRTFELQNEARLRRLRNGAHLVQLGALTDEEAKTVLSVPYVPDRIPASLRTPHALDLIGQLSASDPYFAFPSSIGELRERFWRTCMEADKRHAQFADALVERLTQLGALWVPRSEFSEHDVVESLLTIGLIRTSPDGSSLGFRHQTLFDFARARRLIREGTLLDFIEANSHLLEIRPLVRSAFLQLRATGATDYESMVSTSFRSGALHLQLLIVDCLLDADAPTPFELRIAQQAVTAPRTRRRALHGIARSPDWTRAVEPSIPAWLSDYPNLTASLASSALRIGDTHILHSMESAWLDDQAGKQRVLDVLASQTNLGIRETSILSKLVPEMALQPVYLSRILESLARTSPDRSLALCLACLHEQYRLSSSENARRFQDDEIACFQLPEDAALSPSTLVLDQLETFLRSHDSQDESSSTFIVHSFLRAVGECIETHLARLAADDFSAVISRATSVKGTDRLCASYLSTFCCESSDVLSCVAWLCDDYSRLEIDPESFSLVSFISERLSENEVERLEHAITECEPYKEWEGEDAASRRERDRSNQRYRLALRARLPQGKRSDSRLKDDERAGLQLPGPPHEPDPGVRGGFVQSPMNEAAIAKATVHQIVQAILKPRDQYKYDENGLPIGGPQQLLSELRRLAESMPERIAEIAKELTTLGQRNSARSLLSSISSCHPDRATIEHLIVELVEDHASLELDDDCASALRDLAIDGPLSPELIDLICRRLENAARETVDEAQSEEDEADNKLALFRDSRRLSIIPRGSYRWLAALQAHFVSLESADSALWVRALNAAVRADRRNKTWTFMLSRHASHWSWLCGAHAADALDAIAGISSSRSLMKAATYAFAHSRRTIPSHRLEGWVDQLADAGLLGPAAELTVLLDQDEQNHPWAMKKLAAWRTAHCAQEYSGGLMAAAGELLAERVWKKRVCTTALEWIPVCSPEALDFLLFDVADEDVWSADQSCTELLRECAQLIAILEPETIGRVVGVLDRWLSSDPKIVLQIVENVLNLPTAHISGAQLYWAHSECLALATSLRLALPEEAARVHAIFERALEADVPAAFEALDTMDGRVEQIARLPRMQRQRPRRRRRS